MWNLHRFEFDGTIVERDGQQFVDGKGMAGDRFAEVYRPEPHGFASVPVKGGMGVVIASRDRRERAFIFGGENPSLRPKGLPAGGKAIYDAAGNVIKFLGDSGITIDTASRTITIATGGWTVDGPVTLNGAVQINGNLNVAGNIVATGSITP